MELPRDAIRDHLLRGETVEATAKALGITQQTVVGVRRELRTQDEVFAVRCRYPMISEKLAEGVSREDLAKDYGVSSETIGRALKALGVTAERVSTRPPSPHIPEILRRAEAGETFQAIADDLGISKQRCQQLAQRYGVVRRPGIRQESFDRKMARKTERREARQSQQAQVAAVNESVRLAVARGLDDRAIAAEVGIPYKRVAAVRKRIGVTGGTSANRASKHRPIDPQRCHELLISGMTLQQVADEVGSHSPQYVEARVRAFRATQNETQQ